jgi:hypothetical protein
MSKIKIKLVIFKNTINITKLMFAKVKVSLESLWRGKKSKSNKYDKKSKIFIRYIKI